MPQDTIEGKIAKVEQEIGELETKCNDWKNDLHGVQNECDNQERAVDEKSQRIRKSFTRLIENQDK